MQTTVQGRDALDRMGQEPEGYVCQPAAAIDACCRFAGWGFSCKEIGISA
jgi:hypothetical protein